jgi:5-methylcytosine-specific restriction endonuclease McrA
LAAYLALLPAGKKLSAVKQQILSCLWGQDDLPFPKPWVSSQALLALTGQKYFDRRTRELRDHLGCDIETAYCEGFAGHGWRLRSAALTAAVQRDYLSATQKAGLFANGGQCCAVCGKSAEPGVRGLQADHRIPLSRGGSSALDNWQALCNHCNVGKRRACEGCALNCETCGWAYPDRAGLATLFHLDTSLLQALETAARQTKTHPDTLVAAALKQYLGLEDRRNV